MGVIEKRRWTVEEYLDWEERQEEKHELVGGRPVAMNGARVTHVAITGNVYTALRSALRGRPCRPYVSDLRVRTGSDGVRCPDVVIDCGLPRPSDRLAARPTVVVEVLSPSTWSVDLNDKPLEYGAVASVAHYLVVAQDRPHVTVWNRVDGALVRGAEFTALTDVVDLPAVEIRLALADVYDEVAFDEAG